MENSLSRCYLCHLCPELLADILEECPQEADGIDSVVVVDNVPQVGPDRLEKLRNVIRKIFSKFGEVVSEFFPEADGKTKGYVAWCTDFLFLFLNQIFHFSVPFERFHNCQDVISW